MKLNSRIHGAVDYGVVMFLWVAPTFFNLPELTAKFTYILGGIHLLLTLATRFELGVFKIIPFRVHGLVEFAVSLALIGAAFYLGNLEGDLAKYFYLSFAIMVLLVWLLTDYKSVDDVAH